jgi:uncharacterized protein YciI
MQFIYQIEPTRPEMLERGPTEEETGILSEHFSYLEQLTNKGIVHLAGRTLDSGEKAFGIVVLNAETDVVAAEIMNMDPAVKHGVMTAELFPFRIALWSNPEAAHD